jgi:hypothetical protein
VGDGADIPAEAPEAQAPAPAAAAAPASVKPSPAGRPKPKRLALPKEPARARGPIKKDYFSLFKRCGALAGLWVVRVAPI